MSTKLLSALASIPANFFFLPVKNTTLYTSRQPICVTSFSPALHDALMKVFCLLSPFILDVIAVLSFPNDNNSWPLYH